MDTVKLSVQAQVDHMKTKGIKFEVITETEAKSFLSDNNYYFKIKSYAKNFSKDLNGNYIDLDFAYLQELSTLDLHLRRFVLRMTLDIEHSLKTKLLRDCANNQREDGYAIVNTFFSNYPDVLNHIETKRNKSYTTDLINKFESNYALWNVVELLSFGDFILLYNLYYQLYPSVHSYSDLLFAVRSIRNAAAHSNCLINTLRTPYSSSIAPNYRIKALCGQITDATLTNSMLPNPVIHDFIATMLLLYLSSYSLSLRMNTFKELDSLFSNRLVRNKDYFSANANIMAAYHFSLELLTFFRDRAYNDYDEQKG